MSCADLVRLRAPLLAHDRASTSDVVAFCKYIRDAHIRDEQGLIASHGLRIIKGIFVIVEQVCIACLDVQNFEAAAFCIALLEKKFGESSLRVTRLRGMRLEFQGQATGDFELLVAATVVYQSILEKDPTDTQTMKRQIALAKSQGLRDSTIRLLNEYLAIFGTDAEAWFELAELYLEHGMYQNASFCFEELIVIQPQNYHLYVKYGEVLYTLGGLENLLLSRKQFSFALELSTNNNMRAWWGLATTANAITNTKGVSAKDHKLSVELFELARDQISKSLPKPSLAPYTQSTLRSLEPVPAPKISAPSASSSASGTTSATGTPASSANTTPAGSSRSKGSRK